MIKVTHDQDGFTYVQYREDKRPLKLCVYYLDSPETTAYFGKIVDFVIAESNGPEHLRKMEPAKLWALIERLATVFCKEYAPTREHGFTKPEIRGAIYFVINNGIECDAWPGLYTFNKRTFVQWADGYRA